MKRKIEDLLDQLGDHPSFTLPPVSLFIEKLRVILNEECKIEFDFAANLVFLQQILFTMGVTDINMYNRTFKMRADPENWHGVHGTNG